MVGRSNIVGLPVTLLLLKEDATVTVVHSHTKEPESIIREADIIIAAAGQAMMVTIDSQLHSPFSHRLHIECILNAIDLSQL